MPAEVTVSVVVPTRNSAHVLGACLETIHAQKRKNDECIVVDNFSTDRTQEIAEPYADIFVQHGPERSYQRNEGLRRATGDVVVFVDSDMTLADDMMEKTAALFGDERFDAAILPERSQGMGFWACCRVLEKEIAVGDAATEAARAFRRKSLEQLGGYDERLIGGEDWDLHDRALEAGLTIGRVDSTLWHDEGRLHLVEVFQKKRYYGRTLSIAVASGGAVRRRRLSPGRILARPPLLLHDPLHACGLIMLKSVDAAGIALGALEQRRQLGVPQQPLT